MESKDFRKECKKKRIDNLFGRESKEDGYCNDVNEDMNVMKLKFAMQNNMFDTVKKSFELLVRNDRNGISSREFFVDEEGNSPLFWATSSGDFNLVKVLVEKYRFPLNDQNYVGNNCIMVAMLSGYEDIACYLLEKGANPNICNLNKESPLHIACCLNIPDVCASLLKHGAWIEAEDSVGDTALHWAVRDENVEVCEILLKNGANIDHRNEDDESPRDLLTSECPTILAQLLDTYSNNVDKKISK